MEDRTLLANYSDEFLNKEIVRLREQADMFRSQANQCNMLAGNYERELEYREADKFPVKKGDNLLVTAELFPKYAEFHHYPITFIEPFIVTVDSIGSYGYDEQRAFVHMNGIEIEAAAKMHEAWVLHG